MTTYSEIKQILRWSDEKLARELAFAIAAKDENHAENLAWLSALKRETTSRAETSALKAGWSTNPDQYDQWQHPDWPEDNYWDAIDIPREKIESAAQ